MLVVAALAEAVLGSGLFLLGRWGRLCADSLVPAFLDPAARRQRADALARAALVGQAIGLVLVLFALGTAVAAASGVDPTISPTGGPGRGTTSPPQGDVRRA